MTIPLTYSNYSTLRSCGRRFKLQCIDLVPQPRAVALEFGSAMHAGLHDVLVTHDIESAQDVFSAYWDTKSISGLNWDTERHKQAELKQMGLKFISNFYKKYGKDMQFVTGEKRLKSPFWAAQTIDTIEGTPDALVIWNSKKVLLDFKTSAYNYLDEKLDSSLQLNLYAWLIEQNEGNHIVDDLSYVVFAKGTGSIQTLRTIPHDRKKALALIQDMVEYWDRNYGFYHKNPNACVMGKYVCPYFNNCWKETT